MEPARILPTFAAILCSLFPAGALAADRGAGLPTIPTPTKDGAETLDARAAAEAETLAKEGREPGFRWEHALGESGITFVHRAVDDAGRTYKMAHYDHGNGLAAADVDGDDRPDLYFTSQIGRNELWRNLGNGRFEDVTETSGVAVANRISVAASFGDSDGDGDPDLFVSTVKQGNLFFENVGGGKFRDATKTSGLGHVGHSSGAVWFDYDRDGRLDLFVTNVGRYTTAELGSGGYYVAEEDAFSGHLQPDRAERSLLYRNLGENRFEEVSSGLGLLDEGWSGDALAHDFDDDGWIDLYVLNMQGDDHLWLNREGKRFEEATDRWFPQTPWGAMGVALLDADGDGGQDLYLTDMHSDMSHGVDFPDERKKSEMHWSDDVLQGGADNLFGNALYRRASEPPWGEISDAAGAEVYWPWGPTAADFDADGLEDLFVTTSMNFPFRYQPNAVLWNLGGRFLDVAFTVGAEPRPGRATQTPWFRVDCSGPEKLEPYCAGRSGPHEVTGTLGSRSSVALDLEGDGDLDLVTNELHSAPQVFRNRVEPAAGAHWLAIELRGNRSNRDGLGARVTVRTANRRIVREKSGKSGYLSQSSLPVYFGLGAAERVEEITIDWPSGVRQVVPGPIAVDRELEIEEAD